MHLHYTNLVSENANVFEYDCLRIVVDSNNWKDYHKIVFFCMSELSSTFIIDDNDFSQKFTFAELSNQNITSQQLYHWSTPIDIIEDYQLYLNQFKLNNSSLKNEIFYNCTLPRFGPKCQYELQDYNLDKSLNEFIDDYYNDYNRFQSLSIPTSITCYTHLKCSRSLPSTCLDWTEICDGHIDCFDNQIDEENCWQLDMNVCQDNEYRCRNGQCIPKLFYKDEYITFDCIDRSDEINFWTDHPHYDFDQFPKVSFAHEDIICQRSSVTSSCDFKRYNFIIKALSTTKNNDISDKCWSVFKCILNFLDPTYLSCDSFCERHTCIKIMKNICPELIYFPSSPVLFGDLYLALTTNESYYENRFNSVSFYFCYNNSYYDNYLINELKHLVNNMTCIKRYRVASGRIPPPHEMHGLYLSTINLVMGELNIYHNIFDNTSAICNTSNVYRCDRSSKCISIYRIRNGIRDCPDYDDEFFDMNKHNITWIDRVKKILFKCELNDKYIPYDYVENGFCDCRLINNVCEDEKLDLAYLSKNILFEHICDGFIDIILSNTTAQNESDEINCQQWECDNINNHCDGVWNCPDGADEVGCYLNSTLNCSSNQHICVSPQTNQFICLSIDKVNDSIVDCLGGTDEPTLMCQKDEFYCRNQNFQPCISNSRLCDDENHCNHSDDEQFCEIRTSITEGLLCSEAFTGRLTNVEHYLCFYAKNFQERKLKYFKLIGMITSIEDQTKNIKNTMLPILSPIETSNQYQQHCYRGLNLRVWLNTKNQIFRNTCLCMSSYYGSKCQYQNQRINLIIKFQASSDSWRTLFSIVIQLIDDSKDRIIHSYEQLTYLSSRDCKTKFNIYLFYSTRPKNLTKQYAIHIDIYEKKTFIYRGSYLLPIKFSFLPVHHLPFIINIPRNDEKTNDCFNDECIYGKCIKYLHNTENLTFCQCQQDWTGKYCTIQYSCRCSSDSLCVGIASNNRSVCICPLNTFGSRCLLKKDICSNNDNSICKNGGQCIINDDYLTSNQSFSCICPKNVTGNRCEIPETKLIISFNKNISLSQQMFIHFIEIHRNTITFQSTVRSTTFRTIFSQESLFTIYWSQVFHLVFIELSNKIYYLTHIQTISHQSTVINKTIQPFDYCPNITKVFNHSFAQLNLIHRIKYYHLFCQNQSLNLSCFYDEVHFCLCYSFGRKRLVNCFKFDHNMTFDCLGKNECENDGQCLQDHPTCPTKSLCICRPCFYGGRCQLNTNEFGLSLDAILTYHIKANIGITHQSVLVQFSLVLTIIFILIGLINGILSLITFKNKTICEVGCGLYLLGSSITTLFTMTMFGLKFFILLFAQMNIITNRSILAGQCYVFDFLLRIFLNMDQWLNACVAAERAITAIIGARFVKKKSKKIALHIILILFLIIIGTCIHDPFSRQLIDETNYDDEDNVKKIWCVVNYKSNLHIYNNVIHVCHFIIPILINLISVITLIRTKVHQQLIIQHTRTYREILWIELKKHKHLIIAPIVLVILGIPRLILTYITKCMNSINSAWIFLIGYFLSFIPSMVTFIVFIFPSTFYKKELKKTINQYRINFKKRLPF